MLKSTGWALGLAALLLSAAAGSAGPTTPTQVLEDPSGDVEYSPLGRPGRTAPYVDILGAAIYFLPETDRLGFQLTVADGTPLSEPDPELQYDCTLEAEGRIGDQTGGKITWVWQIRRGQPDFSSYVSVVDARWGPDSGRIENLDHDFSRILQAPGVFGWEWKRTPTMAVGEAIADFHAYCYQSRDVVSAAGLVAQDFDDAASTNRFEIEGLRPAPNSSGGDDGLPSVGDPGPAQASSEPEGAAGGLPAAAAFLTVATIAWRSRRHSQS